ncbi:MAG TPA: serine hydrolase [Myxococcales bacterium]|nr:serine hydrolase [Myxococcales bacterium]
MSLRHLDAMALAVIGLVLFAPGPASAGVQPGSPSDEEIRQMLVTRVAVQKQATGIVVGIIGPQGRRLVAFGTMAAGDQRPVGGDTVFDVGSLTKVFTALLLADMAHRGEVVLEAPVSTYLPANGVKVPKRGGRQITLVDLATHTSGLPPRPTNLVSNEPENKYAGYTVDLMYQCLSSLPGTGDRETRYEYSNLGYGLLGHALARRAERSYAELLRARITEPLGLADTRIDLTPGMRTRLAAGYDSDLVPAPHWDFGALESAGALRSTANDLLSFLEAVLGYHKTDLAPAMGLMLATRRPGGMQPSTQIALAWNVLSSGGGLIAWKNGSVGGYRSFLGYDPSARVGVVALANAQTAVGVDDIGLHVLDPSQPVNLRPPKAHHEVPIDSAVLDRYVGRYRFSATDVLTVTRDGNRLYGQEPGQDKFEMFAEGERDFFLKVIDAQVTFELQGDGPAAAALWHQDGQDQRGVRIKSRK